MIEGTLLKVRPGARWALDAEPSENGEYVEGIPGLVWLDDVQPPPTPEELDAAAATVWRDPVIADFKAEREKLLNRMMSIAGRVARNGETAFAAALDWMAEQIIPLDAHPLVTAATGAESMREAFKQAYRLVALQALNLAPGMELDPPDTTVATQWQTEIDKVFK